MTPTKFYEEIHGNDCPFLNRETVIDLLAKYQQHLAEEAKAELHRDYFEENRNTYRKAS